MDKLDQQIKIMQYQKEYLDIKKALFLGDNIK